MNALFYYLWLAVQSVTVLVLLPYAGILFLAGAFMALVFAFRLRPEQRLRALAGTFASLVIPAAVLLCGVVFAHNPLLDSKAPTWPLQLIHGLLVAQLGLGALLVSLLRGIRFFVLAMSTAAFGYAIGAWFISGMSISGEWL